MRSAQGATMAGRLAWASIACVAVLILFGVAARAASPFDSLLGSWSGAGQIKYNDGRSESIKCSAYYTGGGDKLRMAIRCKSASNEVEIRGLLTEQAGKVTGSWEERTFNASGEASGRLADGRLSVAISGGGFSGSMSVSYGGSRQVVVISTQGIPMRSVNVTLGRS